MSADDFDSPEPMSWRRSFKDRVDFALRHAEPSEGAMIFPSDGDGDGWLLEEAAPGVVYVRWNNVYGARGPGDYALRARLLDPVERFLLVKQYTVTRHRDQHGPYVRVTR